MNPIKNNGKYFIKDAEISDLESDKFKHGDIAKNIINIIENNTAPFNIAIVGKWGLGKSSLINIVKQHFSTQNGRYIIEDINAWKYEKEALKRVLLRKTLSSLDYTDNNSIKELLENLISHRGRIFGEKKKFLERLKTEWFPLFADAAIIYVIGVFLSILGQCIISKVNVSEFDLKDLLSFVLGNFVSNFYIPLLAVLFQRFINTSKGKYDFKITPPITSVDEYESELEKRLSNERYKHKKFIVIIDDLDRLTPNKIVEALDAIKAFVGYHNFIFIVPFDDTILRDAIKREKTNFAYNEHLTIESDLFLDKLFQYRISLPNIIQSNLPEYAIEAAKKDAEDLLELCGKEDFELICKEILIHKKVSTPRQVKKIVNTFANNVLLGYRRECNGVSTGVFTSLSGKRFLAKISVLQADFPTFYSNLFVDNSIIDAFLALTDSEKIEEINNELLLSYFTKKQENCYILNKTGESLSMFLHRTSAITVSNIARFLYLNDDRLSELFGNEFSSTIRDGLTSGEYKLVREKINSNPDKNITQLLYEVLSNSDPIEFEFCTVGIINVSDIDDVKNNMRLLSLVNDRLNSIFISSKTILAENLNLINAVDIFKLHNEFSGFNKLILNQFKNRTNDIVDNMSIFFEKEDAFSLEVKDYVKDIIINKCATSEINLTFKSLFEINSLDIDYFFNEYFSSIRLFERIYEDMLSSENYNSDDIVVLTFARLFEKHIQNNNANEILKIVVSNLENSEFAELLIHIMASNADVFNESGILSSASSKLIEASNDSINDDINLWLSKVDWEITSDKNELVDKYLEENLSSRYIDSILLKIANNTQINLIPITIKAISDRVFNKNIKISTLYELQKQYDESQMTGLIEKLKPAFANSSSDEYMLDYATEILKWMSKDENNEKYVTLMADYIYSQNSSNAVKMIDKIKMMSEFKFRISDTVAKKFISWSNSNISSYPMSSVILLDIFKMNISKTEYVTYSDKIIKYVTQDTLELSLSLLRIFRTEFGKGSDILTTYKDFLVNQLSNNHCRKSIIQDITNYFSKIGDVDQFINETIKYDDILNESVQAITKFTEDYNEESIISVVQDVIEAANRENITNMNNIFNMWLASKYNSIICRLLENVNNSISIMYGMNMLKLSMPMIDVDTTLKINLISVVLEICDDTMLEEVLFECEKLGKLRQNSDKRMLGESLYNAFRNTAINSVKKQIFSSAILTGTRTAFETDEQKNKREFSDEEVKLLKQNK